MPPPTPRVIGPLPEYNLADTYTCVVRRDSAEPDCMVSSPQRVVRADVANTWRAGVKMVKKVRRGLRNCEGHSTREEKFDDNSIFREFLRSPSRTGAVTAGSQALAEQSIAPIEKRGNPVAVELEPGTDADTTAILAERGLTWSRCAPPGATESGA